MGCRARRLLKPDKGDVGRFNSPVFHTLLRLMVFPAGTMNLWSFLVKPLGMF